MDCRFFRHRLRGFAIRVFVDNLTNTPITNRREFGAFYYYKVLNLSFFEKIVDIIIL